jgi:heat shock protein HtpX
MLKRQGFRLNAPPLRRLGQRALRLRRQRLAGGRTAGRFGAGRCAFVNPAALRVHHLEAIFNTAFTITPAVTLPIRKRRERRCQPGGASWFNVPRPESPMSYVKAAGLMLLIHLAFAGLGWSLAGRDGALAATLIAFGFHMFVFWYAEKIVLKLHNAREVASDDASPMIRAFVADCDKLCMRANMPRPRTYIIDAHQPNAFVAGRDATHASIAVTDGLLKTLTRAEVSAVVAHELAHVKRGDALAMGVCAALAALLASVVGAIAWPVGQRRQAMRMVSGLVARAGRSHAREFEADRTAGEICGSPVSLANALLKLERHAMSLLNPVAEKNPSMALLFVIDPLQGERRRPSATHPPTERRVARLHRQAAEMEGNED